MTTKPLIDIRCPNCGFMGQVKLKYDAPKDLKAHVRVQIDHYQQTHKYGQTKYHGKWSSTCYFGKAPNALTPILMVKFPSGVTL